MFASRDGDKTGPRAVAVMPRLGRPPYGPTSLSRKKLKHGQVGDTYGVDGRGGEQGIAAHPGRGGVDPRDVFAKTFL